jgi:mono/diheme cytochrome c family protein
MPRNSVPGTIARGSVNASLSETAEERLLAYMAFSGEISSTAVSIPANGSVPYPYADTEDDRIRAAHEMLLNPYPITEAGLAKGAALYSIYCGVCHGAQGDGLGYLVREADPSKGIIAGVYPAAPANFLKENFMDTTNGFFYHSIMYGKNMMGAYADKLSFEERWQVIHYIRIQTTFLAVLSSRRSGRNRKREIQHMHQ